jgi:hypothetical protein
MSTEEIALRVLLVIAVGVTLAMAGIGLWAVRVRRKAWEQYVKARDAKRVTMPNGNPYPTDRELRRMLVIQYIKDGELSSNGILPFLLDGTISHNDYRAAVAGVTSDADDFGGFPG